MAPACTLSISPSHEDLLAATREFLAAQQPRECLLVAPTRKIADACLRGGKPRSWMGVHRYSLRQLAAQLSSPYLASEGLAPVARLGREALASRAVAEERKRAPLTYFEPVADTPGFARSLLATLDELRLEGVDPARLVGSGAAGPDLARLLGRYSTELALWSLADDRVLFQLAIRALADDRPTYQGMAIAFLDIEIRHATERGFVQALLEGRSPMLAAVCSADGASQRFWAEAGFSMAASQPGAGASTLSHVQANLLVTEAVPAPESDGSVWFFSAASESLEGVEIARTIQREAASGLRFDQCAILLRTPSRYQPLVAEALRRASIPAWYASGTSRPDPAGRAFPSLLQCAREQCSASRFAEYLSLAQVPGPARADVYTPPADELFPESSEQEQLADAPAPVSPFQWERVLVDAAVVGGEARWRKRLDGAERELLRRLDGTDDKTGGADERQLEQVRALRGFALPLIAAIAPLANSQMTWGGWLDALEPLATMALRQPETVLSLLELLRPMNTVGPVSLAEVVRVIELHLRSTRAEATESAYGKVFVGSVEEARGRSFEVVFVPGLAEGVFPRRALEDALLLDEARRGLGGLRLRADRALDERLLLHRAVGSAGRKLIVSYPRLESAANRPLVPSFYALELVKAAQGTLPDLKQLEREAAALTTTSLAWPAPNQPDQAIDDAEYDLAWHRDLRGRADLGGTGHYLVGANAHLSRSLRAEYLRQSRRWTSADGLNVTPAQFRAVSPYLAPHLPQNRAYSASELQLFASCPYRFYLKAILHLRPRQESVALERMDALTRGLLFHDIQRALLERLRQADLLPVHAANLDQVYPHLDDVWQAQVLVFAEEFAPAIPRVWNHEVESVRLDLRGWLQSMAEEGGEWLPVHFELAFGLQDGDGRDLASVPHTVPLACGVNLRGAIDLVELRGAEVRVTDHKTGAALAEPPQCTGRGEVLQPLLYAEACEQLFPEMMVKEGRLSFCTRRGGYTTVTIPLSDEGRHQLRDLVESIGSQVQAGALRAEPHSNPNVRPARDACEHCDFVPICGSQAARRAKRKGYSESLQRIRSRA